MGYRRATRFHAERLCWKDYTEGERQRDRLGEKREDTSLLSSSVISSKVVTSSSVLVTVLRKANAQKQRSAFRSSEQKEDEKANVLGRHRSRCPRSCLAQWDGK